MSRQMDSSAHSNAPSAVGFASRLLNLAPELRNVIYAFVLPDTPQEFRFMYGQHPAIPSLLHVNKQVRNEVIGMYYGESKFDFIVHYRCTRLFLDWIRTQTRGVRQALLKNHDVNVRIIIDKSHKKYEKIKGKLGNYGLIDETLCYYSVEDFAKERLAVTRMLNVERARDKRRSKEQARQQDMQGGEAPAPYPSTEKRFLLNKEVRKVSDEVFAALRAP